MSRGDAGEQQEPGTADPVWPGEEPETPPRGLRTGRSGPGRHAAVSRSWPRPAPAPSPGRRSIPIEPPRPASRIPADGGQRHPASPAPASSVAPRSGLRADPSVTSESLTSESLTSEEVLRARADRPAGGWRALVYAATGGRVNPGPSPVELRERQRDDVIRTPIPGCHRLAVISLKGGVGKTTTTTALGATFASVRGDRVIAIDANPDRGTLGEKVRRESDATVRDLLAAAGSIERYSDVRPFTSQGRSRLEVLASDADPGVSQAFGEADYRQVLDILERYYNLILTDCGTGLLHSAMAGVLAAADSLVLVSSPSLDGARSASATLDWLEAHDYGELARDAVAVISGVRPGRGAVDLGRLEEHFAARCRAVVRVPHDSHLEAGATVELDELQAATREAYRELAAVVAEGFGAGRRDARD